MVMYQGESFIDDSGIMDEGRAKQTILYHVKSCVLAKRSCLLVLTIVHCMLLWSFIKEPYY